MFEKGLRKQLHTLYGISLLDGFKIAGASWVALLYVRGFTLPQIAWMEGMFHVVSLCCEIPSGVIADVFGRKRTMVLSQSAGILSTVMMLTASSFAGITAAVMVSALRFNLSSGTREAIAYDSMKEKGKETFYMRFASTENIVYVVASASATLCAGLALFIGFQAAYLIDLAIGIACLLLTLLLKEPSHFETQAVSSFREGLMQCVKESTSFLKENERLRRIIFVNALIGAFATLTRFFLQAKLQNTGLPTMLLGPALFVIGLGAAAGTKVSAVFEKIRYVKIVLWGLTGAVLGTLAMFFQNPVLLIAGGFLASFSDDFVQVRTDVLINDMIPSAQRSTLISVNEFVFSMVMIVLSPLLGVVFG